MSGMRVAERSADRIYECVRVSYRVTLYVYFQLESSGFDTPVCQVPESFYSSNTSSSSSSSSESLGSINHVIQMRPSPIYMQLIHAYCPFVRTLCSLCSRFSRRNVKREVQLSYLNHFQRHFIRERAL